MEVASYWLGDECRNHFSCDVSCDSARSITHSLALALVGSFRTVAWSGVGFDNATRQGCGGCVAGRIAAGKHARIEVMEDSGIDKDSF